MVEVVLKREVKQSRFASTHTRAMASVCVSVTPFMRTVYATQRVLRIDFALPTRPELAASFSSTNTAFKVAYTVEARYVRGSSTLLSATRGVWLMPVVDAADPRALPAGYQEQPAVAVSARVGGRWSGRKGAMRATVSLQQRAYCPGELVPIAIALSNQSSVAVHGMFVSLSQFLWKHGHRAPASEEVLLESSNVLEASGKAADQGAGKEIAVKVAMPVPTGAGTTPTWVYDRYRVSHAIRVTVYETETRTKSRQLLVANLNFVLASCRGVPRNSTHMYMYNLALAQTAQHPQKCVASQYMLPPSTSLGGEATESGLAGTTPSYSKIVDSDDSGDEYEFGYVQPHGSAPPAVFSDDEDAEGVALQKKQQQPQPQRHEAGGTEEEEEADEAVEPHEGVCVVCQERHQTHCIVPCGHRCLCGPCAKLFQKTAACPVCRGPVATIIRVFDV